MFDVIPVTTDKETACGPACLKMFLDYYDTDVELDTLIEECAVGVAGCSAGDLKRVAKAHGLSDVIAYQMDSDELILQDRPAIIWWKYTHWCVFCGQSEGQVVICNPSRGRYKIDKGTFKSLYSGVSLWNGDPQPLPEPDPDTDLADLAEAARILLGVSE